MALFTAATPLVPKIIHERRIKSVCHHRHVPTILASEIQFPLQCPPTVGQSRLFVIHPGFIRPHYEKNARSTMPPAKMRRPNTKPETVFPRISILRIFMERSFLTLKLVLVK